MRTTDLTLTPPPDAETQWQRFERMVRNEGRADFSGGGAVFGARAPGRLDVLGGVSDYSGGLVLEMPLAVAACTAWQWRDDRQLRIRSLNAAAAGLQDEVRVDLDDLVDQQARVRPASEVRDRLRGDARTHWATYVAGCFYVMLAAHSKVAQGKASAQIGERGANVLIDSSVPIGAGVASSAAIEVATMHALSDAAGIHPSDLTLAAWCQRVENLIVGAPCGIMDQVTAALGGEGTILAMRCQPHNVLGNQRIPQGWRFLGLDSGVKHSVAGGRYTRARVAAFMGLKVIQLESGGKLLDNYLCKLSPDQFAAYAPLLPESLSGSEYTRLYGLLPDKVTSVDPDETYRPRTCAEHPVLENERAGQLLALMQIAAYRDGRSSAVDAARDETLVEAGRLMYESHASYSDRLDLGSPETDLLVDLVREQGPERGLFGARITGGGGGGTVAVLCEDRSRAPAEAIAEVCRVYRERTGVTPDVLVGSSPGALAFGAREVMLSERGES